jgi:hypothetical protein
MTDQQDQGNNTQDSGTRSEQERSQQRSNNQNRQSNDSEERMVPYHRFSQLNETNKTLQKELDDIRQAQEREAEERARQQGDFERMYKSEKDKADREKQRRVDLERQIAERERLSTFRAASRDVILADAVEDAFYMLHPDDFKQIDNSDEAAMRRLAEGLVDRKPFLAAASGPMGAGSGGYTNRPILSPMSPSGGNQQEKKPKKNPFQNKHRRPSWK